MDKLTSFLTSWVFKDENEIRQFQNVNELHYFLLGYQVSESNNLIELGHGHWISEFMIFCDTKLNDRKNDNIEILSGQIYYKKILKLQDDDKDGLIIFKNLFFEFLNTYKLSFKEYK